MPEIGTSSSMSGDGKRGVGHRPQATAPILDSTKAVLARAIRLSETMISAAKEQHHSGVIPANLTTPPHFSLSSAKSFPNSAGVLTKTLPPKSASRALIFGSARPALISLLSMSTISAGVFLGAPMANQALVS